MAGGKVPEEDLTREAALETIGKALEDQPVPEEALEEKPAETVEKPAEEMVETPEGSEEPEGELDSEVTEEGKESTETTVETEESKKEPAEEIDGSAVITLNIHGKEVHHTLDECVNFTERHLGGEQKFQEAQDMLDEVKTRQKVLDRTSQETTGIDADGATVLKFLGEFLRDSPEHFDDVVTAAIERHSPDADEAQVNEFKAAVRGKLREIGQAPTGRGVIHSTTPDEQAQAQSRIKSVFDNELPGFLDKYPIEMAIQKVGVMAQRAVSEGQMLKDEDLPKLVKAAANELNPDLYFESVLASRELKKAAPSRKTKATKAAKAVGGKNSLGKVDPKFDLTSRKPEDREKVASHFFSDHDD